MKRGLIFAAALLAAAAALIAGTPAAALERGAFGWRADEATGMRPLLVIWLRDPDGTAGSDSAGYARYLSEIVFGTEVSAGIRYEPSVAGYYREVSGGKFGWSRAGLVGPLAASLKGKQPNDIARLALETAAAQGGFNFKALDANRDGRVTANELAVLIVTSDGAGRRWQDFTAAEVAIPDQGVSFAGRVAFANENDNLAIFNRELFHVVAPDAVDLEGWPNKCFVLNRGLSLMAATNTSVVRQTMHLDPWHKMLAGWIEPRIPTIDKPGRAKLAAQHVSASADLKRPILIYDGTRTPTEFFLLEYRTRNRQGFDQDVGTSGLVIWHVMLDRANRVFKAPADRKNCKGETLPVQTLFVRGASDWMLGSSRAWVESNGPITLKWMDGSEAGVKVTVAHHRSSDWAIDVSWTAGAAGH
jgi:M6 family metalloprotease-like protein